MFKSIAHEKIFTITTGNSRISRGLMFLETEINNEQVEMRYVDRFSDNLA